MAVILAPREADLIPSPAGKKKGADLIYSRKQAGNINKWNQKQAELKQPEAPPAPPSAIKSSANSTPIASMPTVHRSAHSAQINVLTSFFLSRFAHFPTAAARSNRIHNSLCRGS